MKSFNKYIMCLLFFLLLAGRAYPQDIVIGMSAAFKGTSKGLGIELYRGAMAYIEHVNSKGGINGRKIIIKAYDDGYNPAPAISNTIHLIEKDNAFLLFNYVGTPTVTRTLPLLKNYRDKSIYLFFPFTGAQPHREPPYDEFVFNLRASYRQETQGLVENLIKIGKPKIAVFYQADSYGRSGWDGVKRALAKYGSSIIAEATYKRGMDYSESMKKQVEILRRVHPDAVISIGSYAACAAFIRDARDAVWDVPIANVSFVSSTHMLHLLLETSMATGRDYTKNLINSQVVPNYNDTTLPAVREYRELMDRYNPMPPKEIMEDGYKPLRYSFTSLEGFLNARLLTEILKRMGNNIDKTNIKKTVEAIKNLDIGIGARISFGEHKHQGLDVVYYTTVENKQFVSITDWDEWRRK